MYVYFLRGARQHEHVLIFVLDRRELPAQKFPGTCDFGSTGNREVFYSAVSVGDLPRDGKHR